jgi:hypothetical protein
MSDVMWIVTNHEEKQAGLPFRVDSPRLFVMSDVIFIAIVRDCRWCCPWYKDRMARPGKRAPTSCEEEQVKSLSLALKDMMRKKLLNAKKNP